MYSLSGENVDPTFAAAAKSRRQLELGPLPHSAGATATSHGLHVFSVIQRLSLGDIAEAWS
jgi:hypothetical protein